MKKISLLAVAVMAAITASAQFQLPNPGFEQ